MNTEIAIPETLELDAGPIRAIDLALYAAASGDHNPLHLDEGVARAAGFEQPLVHGMLSMAHAARAFTARFGPGTVKSITVRFVGVARRDDRLHFAARLVGRDGEVIKYEFGGRTQDGGEVIAGSADIVLPGSP